MRLGRVFTPWAAARFVRFLMFPVPITAHGLAPAWYTPAIAPQISSKNRRAPEFDRPCPRRHAAPPPIPLPRGSSRPNVIVASPGWADRAGRVRADPPGQQPQEVRAARPNPRPSESVASLSVPAPRRAGLSSFVALVPDGLPPRSAVQTARRVARPGGSPLRVCRSSPRLLPRRAAPAARVPRSGHPAPAGAFRDRRSPAGGKVAGSLSPGQVTGAHGAAEGRRWQTEGDGNARSHTAPARENIA